MSKKRPPPEFITQMRQALTATDREDWPAELAWARGVLAGQVTEPPPDLEPEVIVALLEELMDRGDHSTIADLTGLKSKTVRKPAGAAVHRLRTKGVDVKPTPAAGRAAAGTGKPLTQSLQSFVTTYDLAWEREIGLVDESPGGLNLVLGHSSASMGLLDAHLLSSMGRKQFREVVKRLKAATTMVMLDHSEARWFMEDAVIRSKEAGRGLPRGFARISQELGPAPGGEHPALALEPAEADNQELMSLYLEPELRGWFPDQRFLQQMELKLGEVFTSKLMIDEQQRLSQVTGVLDRLLEDYFTSDRCRGARQLLLDSAHVASRRDRGEVAGKMRQASELFLDAPERLVEHPFVRQFLERLVNAMGPMEPGEGEGGEGGDDEERSEGGLIIP